MPPPEAVVQNQTESDLKLQVIQSEEMGDKPKRSNRQLARAQQESQYTVDLEENQRVKKVQSCSIKM